MAHCPTVPEPPRTNVHSSTSKVALLWSDNFRWRPVTSPRAAVCYALVVFLVKGITVHTKNPMLTVAACSADILHGLLQVRASSINSFQELDSKWFVKLRWIWATNIFLKSHIARKPNSHAPEHTISGLEHGNIFTNLSNSSRSLTAENNWPPFDKQTTLHEIIPKQRID